MTPEVFKTNESSASPDALARTVRRAWLTFGLTPKNGIGSGPVTAAIDGELQVFSLVIGVCAGQLPGKNRVAGFAPAYMSEGQPVGTGGKAVSAASATLTLETVLSKLSIALTRNRNGPKPGTMA